MTITAADTKYRYEGNGVTITFSYPNRVYAQTDLIVDILTRTTSELEETLTLTTDYSVTIAANGQATVTITNATKIPSVTQDILIRLSLPLTQTLELPTGTPFPAKNTESSLDKLTSIAQALAEVDSRCLKYNEQSPVDSGTLPNPVDNATVVFDGTSGSFKIGPTVDDIADAADNAAIAIAAADRAEAAVATVALNNYAATTNPTVNDDSADGYSVGSRWVNTSTGTSYECVNATVGAAVWSLAVDTTLASIAALNPTTDESIYFTGTNVAAAYSLTAAGRALAGGANAAAQRTSLGLGTAALKNTGTSGDAVGLLNTANTYTGIQTFSDEVVQAFNDKTSSGSSTNNNTTLQNIPGLSWSLAAGKYMFQFRYRVDQAAASGHKIAANFSGTTTSFRATGWLYNGSAFVPQDTGSASPIAVSTTGTSNFAELNVYIETGTSGTFAFQYAQQASGATFTSINGGYTSASVRRLS